MSVCPFIAAVIYLVPGYYFTGFSWDQRNLDLVFSFVSLGYAILLITAHIQLVILTSIFDYMQDIQAVYSLVVHQ